MVKSWYLAAATLFAAAQILSIFPIESEDLPMYLAIGRRILSAGQIPMVDPFLYSIPNYHWTVAHQWLNHVFFYILFQYGSWEAVTLFKAAFLSLLPAAVLIMARRREVFGFFPLLITSIALSASLWRFVERSAIFSEVFTVLVLFILLERRESSRGPMLLPVIFLLWANLHPGYPVGLALLALALVSQIDTWRDKRWRTLLNFTLLSAVACLLNPKGLQGALYPFKFFGEEARVMAEYYTEWWPIYHPSFMAGEIFPRYCVLVTIGFFALLAATVERVKQRQSFPFFEWLAFLGFVGLAISAIRFVPTSSFAIALLSMHTLSVFPRDGFFRARTWANWVFVVVASLLLGYTLRHGYRSGGTTRTLTFGLSPQHFPIENVERIKRLPREYKIFNNHDFGGYLAWIFNGERQVYYHGFVTDLDFYRSEFIRMVRSTADMDDIVRKNDLRIILVDKAEGYGVFKKLLERFPEWKLEGVDGTSVLWVRAGR